MKTIILIVLMAGCSFLHAQTYFEYNHFTHCYNEEKFLPIEIIQDDIIISDSVLAAEEDSIGERMMQFISVSSNFKIPLERLLPTSFWDYRRNTYDNDSTFFYSYDSIMLSYDALPFQKQGNDKIYISFPKSSVPMGYVIKQGKLFVKINGLLVKVFDNNYIAGKTFSRWAATVLLAHYREVEFFNRTYKNVYEFLFALEKTPTRILLVWFDENYNLIRLQYPSKGFLLNDPDAFNKK